MRRVAVIGCGGAGKTTLARALGARLALPVVHIDGHYWRGDVELRPDEWAAAHRGLIDADRWVIDGMKLGTLPERLERADTVVFLDLPARTCLLGVARRRARFRGAMRPDLGVYDRITWEFLRWNVGFRRRHRPRIVALLAAHRPRVDVVILRSRRDVRRWLAGVGTGAPGETRAAPIR